MGFRNMLTDSDMQGKPISNRFSLFAKETDHKWGVYQT